MKRNTFKTLFILFALTMMLFAVACSNEAETPEPEPDLTEYVVTFNTQNGSPIDPVTVINGQKVAKPTNPTKEGCIFAGWWTDSKYSKEYSFSSPVKSNLTLYAKWNTTKFYMPNGWAKLLASKSLSTPVWTTKDSGIVDTSAIDLVLEGDMKTEVTNVTPELEAALTEALKDPNYFKDVKNIIIIISDGMGITHVQASEQWSGNLIMTKLPNVGASKTLTREDEVTDSAAGGNAISTGYKTTKLFVNMDAEGNNLKNLSELARENNKLVGIVTNAELADATPADFSVHNKNRSQGWTKICQQQVVFGADLFMGNGYSDYRGYFESGSPLYSFVSDIALCSTAEEVVGHFTENKKMWAVFPATANKFARFDTASLNYPNLQQMTAYALSWLDYQDSTNNGDQGFIVMIENTYTDHFGHNNNPSDGTDNTYGIVKEVQSTDEAVAIALKYVLEHPDTALIVTADHETGNTTLRDGWEKDFSKVKAASKNHSGQDVPVFAIGKGTDALNTLTRTEDERAAGLKWDTATAYENARIGQVIGALILGENPDSNPVPFGGNVVEDATGKTSAKFDITVTQATSSLVFTLDLTGAPIYKNEIEYSESDKKHEHPINTSLIQFKIKPVNPDDKISIDLKKSDNSYVSLFSEAAFKTAVDPKAEDFVGYDKDGVYNIVTPLSKALKQAFVIDSDEADGWYQFSLPATADSRQIRITLKAANSGTFAKDAVITMDDLTIQYASTIGELVFGSSNANSTLPVPAGD